VSGSGSHLVNLIEQEMQAVTQVSLKLHFIALQWAIQKQLFVSGKKLKLKTCILSADCLPDKQVLPII